jgi:hypothetical protein
MAIEAQVGAVQGNRYRPPFAPRHPADAWFFPTIVAVIWLIMLTGFVPEVVQRAMGTAKPYPLVIHAHAIVFFGWLVFLASQVALIRTGNVAWHRRMGIAGAVLAAAVAVFGPAAAFTMQMAHEARQPPQFLAIQLLNIAAFVAFVAAGFAFRHDAAAHKRLMLVATLALIGAGFGRVVRLLTGGPAPFTLIPGVYVATNVLLLAIALYDYRTRGRVHPVFIVAACAMFGVELLAGLLLRSPAWIEFTRALVS